MRVPLISVLLILGLGGALGQLGNPYGWIRSEKPSVEATEGGNATFVWRFLALGNVTGFSFDVETPCYSEGSSGSRDDDSGSSEEHSRESHEESSMSREDEDRSSESREDDSSESSESHHGSHHRGRRQERPPFPRGSHGDHHEGSSHGDMPPPHGSHGDRPPPADQPPRCGTVQPILSYGSDRIPKTFGRFANRVVFIPGRNNITLIIHGLTEGDLGLLTAVVNVSSFFPPRMRRRRSLNIGNLTSSVELAVKPDPVKADYEETQARQHNLIITLSALLGVCLLAISVLVGVIAWWMPRKTITPTTVTRTPAAAGRQSSLPPYPYLEKDPAQLGQEQNPYIISEPTLDTKA